MSIHHNPASRRLVVVVAAAAALVGLAASPAHADDSIRDDTMDQLGGTKWVDFDH
jgi:hypothetical protein